MRQLRCIFRNNDDAGSGYQPHSPAVGEETEQVNACERTQNNQHLFSLYFLFAVQRVSDYSNNRTKGKMDARCVFHTRYGEADTR